MECCALSLCWHRHMLVSYWRCWKRRQGPLPCLLSSFCRPLSNKKKECEVKETFCSVYQLECCTTLSSSEDGREGHIYLLRGSYSLGGPQGSKICQRHSRQSLLFFLFFIPISATRNVCSRHSLYTYKHKKSLGSMDGKGEKTRRPERRKAFIIRVPVKRWKKKLPHYQIFKLKSKWARIVAEYIQWSECVRFLIIPSRAKRVSVCFKIHIEREDDLDFFL